MAAEKVRPCGRLAEILTQFEASETIAQQIARRVGGVVGNGLSHGGVESVILDNITPDGLPQWEVIFNRLGQAANRIYKGKSPFRG